MKRKALAIVLTLLMLVSVLPMGAFAASYTDTEGHWAEKSIDRWTEAKNPAGQSVLEGMGDNVYAPDDNLTRAQAMTIFSRLLNLVETADISKITDVASDAWYAQWIEKGYAYKIINGTSDTTFDPDGSITREQFFSIFARAMGIPGTDKLAEGKTFTDLDDVSSWFVEEGTVYAMINAGYLNGYPDGSLQPKGNITRAEVAQVLANAIDSKGYITADGTYSLTDMTGIVVVLAKNVTLTGNYTGHIVSSCVDSTLYTTQVNPSSVRAAVNTAADNVRVSNVGVANPPYTPANPYNANGANYVYVLQDNTKINPVAVINGGGGGGSVTPILPTDTVLITLNASLNNRAFELSAKVPYYTKDNGAATSAILRALGNKAPTDTGIINTINTAFAEITPDKGKDTRDTVVGDYTVSVAPAVIEKDQQGNDVIKTPPVATVTGPAPIDVKGSMDQLGKDYMDAMKQAAADAGFVEGARDGVYAAWVALAEVFDPAKLFDCGQTTMAFWSADVYAGKVADALNKLAAFIDVASDAQVKAIFDKVDDNWDAFNAFFFDTCNLLTDSAVVNAASGTILSANTTLDSGAAFVTAYDNFSGINVTDPVLNALINAAFVKTDIHGPYSLSIVASTPKQ